MQNASEEKELRSSQIQVAVAALERKAARSHEVKSSATQHAAALRSLEQAQMQSQQQSRCGPSAMRQRFEGEGRTSQDPTIAASLSRARSLSHSLSRSSCFIDPCTACVAGRHRYQHDLIIQRRISEGKAGIEI